IGWEWQKDEPGEDPDGDGSIYRYDDAGRKLLVSEAPMPDSVKNNGLLVVCQTYLLEDLHALSDRPLYDAKLSGGEVVPFEGGEEREDEGGSSSLSPHLNHFVSAVPRYDDTKYVETERSRAGFYRSEELPYL